jgi:hypothetical protein
VVEVSHHQLEVVTVVQVAVVMVEKHHRELVMETVVLELADSVLEAAAALVLLGQVVQVVRVDLELLLFAILDKDYTILSKINTINIRVF